MPKKANQLLLLIVLGFLTSCHQISGPQQMDQAEAVNKVAALVPSGEKTIAVAVLESPNSLYRIDNHGYPTWIWQRTDGLGAAVHIDPQTTEPYLETQYPESSRGSLHKYVDFATDGQDWQCRLHVTVPLHEQEKNWSDPLCHQKGKELLDLLLAGFAKERNHRLHHGSLVPGANLPPSSAPEARLLETGS